MSTPIPISRLGHRYFVYDLVHVKTMRESHNILGVFIGTLPQHSQQNVFKGLPLELMAEEARLLVEQGAAYIVDDVEIHTSKLKGLGIGERQAHLRGLQKQGIQLARASERRAEENTRAAMQKMSPEKREKVQAKLDAKMRASASVSPEAKEEEGSLFTPSSDTQPATPSSPSSRSTTSQMQSHHSTRAKPITPTTSYPPLPPPSAPDTPTHLPTPPPEQNRPFSPFSPLRLSAAELQPLPDPQLPPVPSTASYALFRHLHAKSYFMSPGLRFGCQYCVYPGDPLRFHSHFLARGYGWDEEFDLMDLVGGGRLGTRVKKAFLIGGPVDDGEGDARNVSRDDAFGDGVNEVRTFCVEWAGM